MMMKLPRILRRAAFLSVLLSSALALAATITGTVTNKTTGKPSGGDSVVLVDVQAGMADAASTTTDSHGHYSLQSSGNGAFLIRVSHQGATYFIAAPQAGGAGDVSVYDVATKIDGIGIDADMILAEAAGGMVRVQERYLVRNTSLPPRAQFSSNTFEFVIPSDAILDGASATRPGGLPTNTRPVPLGQKGHYTINIPIQPDQGEKETLFEVQYHASYSGKYTFAPQPQLPADNVVVYVPKGMTFNAGKGATFQPAQEDPRVQTFVTKNVRPGQAVEFTISGEGQMPREPQSGGMGQQAGMGDVGAGDSGSRPGGGIGVPIDTPDPLSKYKWWILGALALLLAAAAAFLLRRQGAAGGGVGPGSPEAGGPVQVREELFEGKPSLVAAHSVSHHVSHAAAPTDSHSALLNSLKEELFAIESERLSGTITEAEYTQAKAGLEAVLKRALKRP